ncbi:hypothetical protein BCD67_14715 [Oscillatoriales cyanobacterium USR001]|nr:hypothetical protein BCD67_14715 [Oscillatoriales cyanobacterium USR001]
MCIKDNLAEAINDVLFSAYKNGALTTKDSKILRSAIEDKSLDIEAQRVVKRLLYAIHRGWVKTVDGDSQ